MFEAYEKVIIQNTWTEFYINEKFYNDELKAFYLASNRTSSQNLYDNFSYLFEVNEMRNVIVPDKCNVSKMYVGECHELCVDLVKKIIKHPLRKNSWEDYKFVLKKAYKELEDIRDLILEELNERKGNDQSYKMKYIDIFKNNRALYLKYKIYYKQTVSKILDKDRMVKNVEWSDCTLFFEDENKNRFKRNSYHLGL